MGELKVGDRVLVPGVVEQLMSVGASRSATVRLSSSTRCHVLASTLQRVPEVLPTVVGSIVELSDGINQLVLVGRSNFVLMQNQEKRGLSHGAHYSAEWVEEHGFRVVYDRGAAPGGV